MSWLRGSGFWPMLRKEFIQMRRDRLTIAMMVGLPAVQLALFGYAIRTEVRHLPTIVMDESRSTASRALVDALRNTGNFDIVATVQDRSAIRAMIEKGDARAALVVPPDFDEDIKRGRQPQAQVIVDAADPLASTAAINAAALAGRMGANARGGVDIRIRPWYNPALKSSHYIVPGLVGLLLSITLIVLTSMAIVRERERGTLEQLVVTPIDKTSLMLGKIVPFALVGYVQMTVILLLGKLLFGIPLEGSIALLYVLSAPFILGSLALGLFVSTIAQTQAQAMQLSFFFMLPNILLSGYMFPREAMPAPAQWIGMVLPLTYYLTILRGILLRGADFIRIWPETLALVVFTLAVLTLSVRRFSKTMG
ncbi:MAG TPA: ABC transporter permease [Gemmatimonadaceae bacterium]|nr:ABC transporter permease [Gemmatimonadaceae bacterium]